MAHKRQRARLTKQGKLAWDNNPIKAYMGVESSAGDLRTMCKFKKPMQSTKDFQISNYPSRVRPKRVNLRHAFYGSNFHKFIMSER